MSRYQAWFALQRSSVDNGTAVSRIVLEGPDATAFATWSISHKDLEESVDGMLESLRESLPKGRHQCRLVSFDQSNAQLSMLPVVVVGASEAATEAAHGRLNQERANSLFLQNAEKQLATTMRVIEHAGAIISAQNESLESMKRERERIALLTDDRVQRAALLQAREERLSLLMEKLMPMVEVGIAVVGSLASEWFDRREGGKKVKESIPASPATRAVELQSGGDGPSTSLEPPSKHVAVLVASTERGEGLGSGCDEGNSVCSAGGDSRSTDAENSMRTRSAKREPPRKKKVSK